MTGFSHLKRLPIKYQIIITFSLITLLLVLGMSWAYYTFIRTSYIRQLSDQVTSNLNLIASGFDFKYLDYLSPGGDQNNPANLYYQEKFNHQSRILSYSGIFLFDDSLRVILKSDSLFLLTSDEPVLLLNQTEILGLAVRQSFVSRAFKAQDGVWYMWGFTRLSDHYWLGIQEGAQRLADIEKIPMISLGIGGISLVFIALAGWMTATMIVNPIHALIDFSRNLGRGHFHISIPDHTRGELSILAEAMEKMRQDIVHNHQEKEEMLAQIAHEIRNPLGGIELLAGLLKEDIIQNHHDPAYINRILKEIAGLKTLITAYLDYSKPIQSQPEWITISTVIRETQELIHHSLQSKKIVLDCSAISDQIEICFDYNHLRQIILNLLVNSLAALPEPGLIQISTCTVDHQFQLRITDSGPGIPAQHLSKIFEPFFSTRKDGTGLGLPICRKLCHENQSTIHVDSNYPQGTRMILTFNPASARLKKE